MAYEIGKARLKQISGAGPREAGPSKTWGAKTVKLTWGQKAIGFAMGLVILIFLGYRFFWHAPPVPVIR